MANVHEITEMRDNFEDDLCSLLAKYDAEVTVDENQIKVMFNTGALDYLYFNYADSTCVEGEE